MLGKLKQHVAPLLHRGALAAGVSTRWALAQPVMRIIMLHGVGDPEYPLPLFRSHLEYLVRHFQVVPLDRLLSLAVRPGYRPRREVALTFDDGLRNNARQVYPILRRLNAPATFYVCPGNIEQRRWIWTVEARIRLRQIQPGAREELARHWGVSHAWCRAGEPRSRAERRSPARVRSGARNMRPRAERGAQKTSVERMQGWMKTLPDGRRREVFAELEQASRDYVPTGQHHEWYDVMSWDELLGLDPQLITIGSHTVSHPMLSRCEAAQREFEIDQSQVLLQQRLGRPVRHFCYPDADLDLDVVRRVQLRHDSAVSCDGLIRPGGVDLFRLPRIPATDELSYFAWRLHNPTA